MNDGKQDVYTTYVESELEPNTTRIVEVILAPDVNLIDRVKSARAKISINIEKQS